MGRHIEILQPGLLTLVQDLGRYGYQQFGVPVAGAMDLFATTVGNLLVENDRNAAVLEMTMLGPQLKFSGDASIALTGGDLGPLVNGAPVAMWRTLNVNDGDVLSFKGMKEGIRCYLAIQGGVDTPLVMNSRSTYTKAALGGYEGRALKKGDLLPLCDAKRLAVLLELPEAYIPHSSKELSVRVILGPQENCFTQAGIETFLSGSYTITNECDRMGYRLEGPPIEHVQSGDIISDGIAFGAVQVPGHGKPIIMMADRQTTGGYTKIAGVISVDLPKLAQAKPGDVIRFKLVTLQEAHQLLQFQESIYRSVAVFDSPPEATGTGVEDQEILSTRLFRLNVAGTVYDVRVDELRV
jgi:biotin-dependent carboxylase-like uncharacterized protein